MAVVRSLTPVPRVEAAVPDRLSKIMQIRLLLAAMGVLFAAVAYAVTRLSDTLLGGCLTDPSSALAHCPWCYAAAAFLLMAVLPLPPRRASIRLA